MVMLKYIGAKATGILNARTLKLPIVRGNTYEIPDNIAKQLLKGNEWEKVRKVVKKEEVKKEEEKIDRGD